VCDGGSSHHSVLRSSVRAVPSARSVATVVMAARRTRLPDALRRHRSKVPQRAIEPGLERTNAAVAEHGDAPLTRVNSTVDLQML
jgi:hypothetical protein